MLGKCFGGQVTRADIFRKKAVNVGRVWGFTE
jgi:hypothetical protein